MFPSIESLTSHWKNDRNDSPQLRDTTSPTETLPFSFAATSAQAAIRGTKDATASFSISAEDMQHYSSNLRRHAQSVAT